MQVLIRGQVYTLTEGVPVQVAVGETIRVFYSFQYRALQGATVQLWASLYRYSLGVLDRMAQAQTKTTVTLEPAEDWTTYEGQVDITIGQVSSGTYGLIVELPEYDVEDHVDDCIEVTAPPSPIEMIGPLLVLGLMAAMVSQMAPMMKEGFG